MGELAEVVRDDGSEVFVQNEEDGVVEYTSGRGPFGDDRFHILVRHDEWVEVR